MREGLHPVRWAREWASSGRLSKPEGDVLKELASYTGDAPVAWPSNATLAASVQQTEKTIRRALDGLEEKGLIVRARDAIGRVLRSREHPIVLAIDIVAAPAAGQMQLELGDQALVTADPAPRRQPAPEPITAPVPVPEEDELARRRREKIAADAASVGAAMRAINEAATVASDDPGLPTTGGEGRQTTPEVPGKDHENYEEGERASARPPDDPRPGGLCATLPAVMAVLRAEFGAEADVLDLAIDSTLSAFPEASGYDHVQAAHLVVAEQRRNIVKGYTPIRLITNKLASELRRQTQQPAAPSARRGDWPPRRRGHQAAALAPRGTGRFVKRSSVEAPDFP